MAVAVVRADGDQTEPGGEEFVEPTALIGRTVVSDLDDVHWSHRPRADEPILRLLSQIAEDERS